MPKINQEEYEVLKGLDDKWRWIARNEDDLLCTFETKPYKDIRSWLWLAGSGDGLINESDFQFIQWEDVVPYNIADLIEEYESSQMTYFDRKLISEYERLTKESEETEVKKNLIDAILNIEVTQFDGQKTDLGELLSQHTLSAELDQLDEPEVLSDKWIDDNSVYASSDGITEEYVHVDDLQNLLVPKWEVLSQEWIERNTSPVDDEGRLYVWKSDLQNLIVPEHEEVDRAYKDGYEKGKEHGFYKGYREGLGDKGGETETVADVLTTFWKSYERLKEVMSMEVEEMEE